MPTIPLSEAMWAIIAITGVILAPIFGVICSTRVRQATREGWYYAVIQHRGQVFSMIFFFFHFAGNLWLAYLAVINSPLLRKVFVWTIVTTEALTLLSLGVFFAAGTIMLNWAKEGGADGHPDQQP